MYTAVANVKVTPAYWEALMQNPDSDRAAAIAQAMASVGGKMHFSFLLSLAFCHLQSLHEPWLRGPDSHSHPGNIEDALHPL